LQDFLMRENHVLVSVEAGEHLKEGRIKEQADLRAA